MDAWDGVLLAVAVAVAVRSLVYLARKRHDLLVDEVQQQVDAHREKMAQHKSKKKDAA